MGDHSLAGAPMIQGHTVMALNAAVVPGTSHERAAGLTETPLAGTAAGKLKKDPFGIKMEPITLAFSGPHLTLPYSKKKISRGNLSFQNRRNGVQKRPTKRNSCERLNSHINRIGLIDKNKRVLRQVTAHEQI